MISKFKSQVRKNNKQALEIIGLKKFELQSKKYLQENERLKVDVKFYQNHVEKLKISLLEYDRKIHEETLIQNDFLIQQLEIENTHLRKLLSIPEDFFTLDPEEEKRNIA